MEKAPKVYDVIVKKIGLRKTASVISGVFWFVLPFVFWAQLYMNVDKGLFLGLVAFPGIVVGLVYVAVVCLSTVQMIRLDKKLMKRIGSAKSLFDKPQDLESERNFRRECHKFIVPYLHYFHLARFGLTGFFQGFPTIQKAAIRLWQTFLVTYLSYSVVTLFIEYKSFLFQIWLSLSKYIPYWSEVNSVLLAFFQNPIPTTALVFLLSLPTVVPIVKSMRLGYPLSAWEIVSDSFSVFTRIMLVAAFLLCLPWIVEKKSRTLNFAPFTFPTSLPAIIQDSVLRIENKVCNVSKWSYVVDNKGDIEELKEIICAQKDIPWLLRLLCLQADSASALNRIVESKPVLYLGTIDARCGIVGRIQYDSREKMFWGQFCFDNRHAKEYFKSVADIEIGEQKKLRGQLHPSISELIGKFGLNEDGSRA